MLLAKERRNSNSSTSEVIIMASQFFKVSCKDCSNEAIIFSRATTAIACGVCGATLTSPAGGNAKLVGCEVLETLQ
jgi:small subunit ribosomal protein S27e